jgi:uncharacterized membrane protein YccC
VRIVDRVRLLAGRGRLPVRDWLSEVVPDWLTEVVRPKPAPMPWPDMARAVLAIWAPLAAGFIAGHRELGLLPALGGLLGIMIDNGGPYLARVRRIGCATVFGGAAGLLIGSVIHGRGWTAVIAIVALAWASTLLARLGGTGSVTGLELFVYSAVGLGPIGALHPWWHTAWEFLAGVVWALLLIVPGWLLSPRATGQRLVASAYHAVAVELRAIGTPEAATARQAVTDTLNAAYDTLLSRRAVSSGRTRRLTRLTAILNVSHQMTEATAALRVQGTRPPDEVIETIDRLASAIAQGPLGGRRPPALPLIPPQWSPDSPGAAALRDSMVSLARAVAGNWEPSPAASPPSVPAARPGLGERLRERAGQVGDQLIGGRVAWTFTVRFTVCAGVAAVVSEVLPLQRSYWVVLTVGIIMKPDLGSVFARALQRGIGTIVGAVLGAAILAVVPYGPLLLIPFGILAALLPYGKSRNFGLSATFLTPLVVVLIDLLVPSGWQLAGARAIDTVLGCAIVLVIGYLPWPGSWYAYLPAKFAGALRVVADYMEEALAADPGSATGSGTAGSGTADSGTADSGTADSGTAGSGTAGSGTAVLSARPAKRSGLRLQALRALSDLRAEFQRTISEPEAVRRRASAWWPAAVSLEELVDAITVTALSISAGRTPAPAPESVRRLATTLRVVADAMAGGGPPPPAVPPLPSDEELQPVTAAVRSVLGVLTPGERG